MTRTTRTFIALDMNEEQQRFLGDIIGRAAQSLPALRWVDPAGIHLTLAFLGELDDERLALAMEAARIAAQNVSPFTYTLKGLGVFDSRKQARVIWMGVEDQPSPRVQGSPLQAVHGSLKRELEQRGFEVEARPFSPHLTLARIKAPLTPQEQQALAQLLQSGQSGALPATSQMYQAHSLYVMKSDLARGAARYTCLKAYDFHQ